MKLQCLTIALCLTALLPLAAGATEIQSELIIGSPWVYPNLTGSWKLMVEPGDGVPPFRTFATMSADGGVVASGQGDSLLGIGSMSTAGHGAWQHVSGSTYLFTIHFVWYGPDGQYDGGAVIRHEVTVGGGGDGGQLAGRAQFDWFDPADEVFFSGESGLSGTRIRAEPLAN